MDHLAILQKCLDHTICLYRSLSEKFDFFLYPYKNYNTCYIYVLLYFLITLQQYNTTGTRPQGAKDNDYPVAVNIKICKKKISKLRLDTNT